MDMLDLLPLPVVEEDSPQDQSPFSTIGTVPYRVSAPTEVRKLTADEIQSLETIFIREGQPLPNPGSSFFVGVVEAGEVKAFLVVQTRVHAEPLWIAPGYQQYFSSITHTAEKMIQEAVGECDVFLFSPAGNTTRLAQMAGMRLEPWTVMSKHISGMVRPQQPEDRTETEGTVQ